MARRARGDLVSIPENPVPDGATVAVLEAADGVRLRAARFPATGRPIKGTVCLFQGRAEFIEKYFELIGDLNRRGFAVATLDWRGQGGSDRLISDPVKGHIRDFSHYQRDLDVFMRDFVLPECPPPIFALAHSMGATIAMIAARRRATWFDRVVAVAPMAGLPGFAGRPMARVTARVLSTFGFGYLYAPGYGSRLMGLGPFADNPVTSDAARYERTAAVLRAAPDLGIGGPTITWVRAAFRVMAFTRSRLFPRIMHVPVLMLTGTQERVVSNRAIERVAGALRTARVLIFDGAKHELLMERDPIRDRVLAAFDAFVPGTDPFPDKTRLD